MVMLTFLNNFVHCLFLLYTIVVYCLLLRLSLYVLNKMSSLFITLLILFTFHLVLITFVWCSFVLYLLLSKLRFCFFFLLRLRLTHKENLRLFKFSLLFIYGIFSMLLLYFLFWYCCCFKRKCIQLLWCFQ